MRITFVANIDELNVHYNVFYQNSTIKVLSGLGFKIASKSDFVCAKNDTSSFHVSTLTLDTFMSDIRMIKMITCNIKNVLNSTILSINDSAIFHKLKFSSTTEDTIGKKKNQSAMEEVSRTTGREFTVNNVGKEIMQIFFLKPD